MSQQRQAEEPICVLSVEDDDGHAELTRRAFARQGDKFLLLTARSVAEANELIRTHKPDIVLADWLLTDGEATDLMRALPDIPVVVMTSQGDEQVAVEVLKAGALDYIVKSYTAFYELPLSVERAFRESRLMRERSRGQERLRAQYECIQVLANATGLERGLSSALTRAAEHLDPAAVEVWLPASVPGEIRRAASWVRSGGQAVALKLGTCQIGEGWLGEAWQGGQDVWLNNLPALDELDPTCSDLALGSVSVHPIALAGEQLGMLVFFGSDPEWASDSDLGTFIAALTVQLAEFLRRFALQRVLIEQERLAALGTTAAVFAHEVGNPLNNMYLHAQILARRVRKFEGGDALTDTIEKIVSEMRRMTSLLEEFRSLSRHQPLVLHPVSIEKILQEVVEMHVGPTSSIQVRWDLAPELPCVLGDHDKLVQVFLNLCKNAVEAMPSGGQLTLRGRADARRVVLEVRDTGPGIPENLDVFEPFKTTKVTGTGLGLPIVRKILSAHGGSVWASSETPQGTVFTVTLPLDAGRAVE